MKRGLELRRIDQTHYERQRIVSRWRRSGYEVALGSPAGDSRYISFWAQGSQGLWQGFVEPQEWLANVLPQLSTLLAEGVTDEEVLELFSVAPRPLDINTELLDYDRLFDLALIDARDCVRCELPQLSAKQCSVWLVIAPSHTRASSPGIQPWLERMPLTLRCSLGSSVLSKSQLRLMAQGDVLCITEQVNQWMLADCYLCSFSIAQEGLYMLQDTDPASPLSLTDELADACVAIEFVLAERTITLMELNDLMSGSILPLDSSVIHDIDIRIGGRSVAVGELIQMESGLGVELREVFSGQAS